MENKKIGYIIPLHKEDDRIFRAIKSVPDGSDVIVSVTRDVEDWFTTKLETGSTVKTVVCDGSSYPSLVNAGVKYSAKGEYDFVSILEFDDTVLEKASNIINTYANDWDDVEILAPLACIVRETEDSDKPVLVGIANEATMAPQIAEEFGFFDFNMMLKTNFLFLNGCYIKPSVFEDYGFLKENFEMLYDYEWALRVVYNGCVIRSIPKATHFHSLTDDGAFETQKALPAEVRENWLGAARREYFFEEDRDINFD
jgi:hypothetical protein